MLYGYGNIATENACGPVGYSTVYAAMQVGYAVSGTHIIVERDEKLTPSQLETSSYPCDPQVSAFDMVM